MEELNEDSFGTINQLKKDYIDFLSSSRVVYQHEKRGSLWVELQFADEPFLSRFNDKSFRNAQDWQDKMDFWYHDQIIWRGMAYGDAPASEKEILSLFTQVHENLASNRVNNTAKRFTDSRLEALARESIDAYNQDLATGKFVKMAKDHTEAGARYDESYGLSTSLNRDVGKALGPWSMLIMENKQLLKYKNRYNPASSWACEWPKKMSTVQRLNKYAHSSAISMAANRK